MIMIHKQQNNIRCQLDSPSTTFPWEQLPHKSSTKLARRASLPLAQNKWPNKALRPNPNWCKHWLVPQCKDLARRFNLTIFHPPKDTLLELASLMATVASDLDAHAFAFIAPSCRLLLLLDFLLLRTCTACSSRDFGCSQNLIKLMFRIRPLQARSRHTRTVGRRM